LSGFLKLSRDVDGGGQLNISLTWSDPFTETLSESGTL